MSLLGFVEMFGWQKRRATKRWQFKWMKKSRRYDSKKCQQSDFLDLPMEPEVRREREKETKRSPIQPEHVEEFQKSNMSA